jgi:uncharacterized protein (DUF1697 family)
LSKYISLLRGINISGQKLIKMAELKLLYESLGFENVRTYLQSGNVIFDTKLFDKKKISGIIEKGIYKKYGFSVSVLIKTTDDFKKILKNNPFLKSKNTDVDKYYITMLFNAPEKSLLEKLCDLKSGNDEFEVFGDVIYINCPDGYGRTKLNNNIFEKKLKVIATTRNWRTINNLSEL